jgi:hypothetical protein
VTSEYFLLQDGEAGTRYQTRLVDILCERFGFGEFGERAEFGESSGFGKEGDIMGREEKRTRERVTRLLAKRLKREPTEEEIEKELTDLHKAQGLAPRRDRKL